MIPAVLSTSHFPPLIPVLVWFSHAHALTRASSASLPSMIIAYLKAVDPGPGAKHLQAHDADKKNGLNNNHIRSIYRAGPVTSRSHTSNVTVKWLLAGVFNRWVNSIITTRLSNNVVPINR